MYETAAKVTNSCDMTKYPVWRYRILCPAVADFILYRGGLADTLRKS